ncbi:MAG: hypothetical protein JO309_08120, partial [Pseudonocardiales bacterium]|nr:hypothetical protein [Pseudonocardiales bacterium]
MPRKYWDALRKDLKLIYTASTPRLFQDHDVSLRILKGRCMSRAAARVASVMSRRPVSRMAPMARL